MNVLHIYQRGDLDFYIADRPVIDDELPKDKKIELLIQSNAPDSAIWKEMGYTDDTIRKWQSKIDSTQQAQEMQVQRQIDALAMKTDQSTNPPQLPPGEQAQQMMQPQPQRPQIPGKVA